MSEGSNIPAVEIAVRTDPGRDPDKQVNEDAAVQKETALGLLAVVCDGMGGHAGGKEASELAIKAVVEIVEAAPAATSPGVALKRAIEEANTRIWSMPTLEAGYRPGSTIVAVLAHPGGAEIAHVGDSRVYLVHAGAISQVTRDHSMVQEMVDRKLIRAEDAAKHPDANKILRALGIAKAVEVELRPTPISYVAGDIFILCSDGLSDLVEPAEILTIAGSHPPAQAAGQLVDLANARGGHDNITAMVMRMKSSATTHEASPLMKTIPLTALPAPLDQGAGPTGTVVSAPLAAPSAPTTTAPVPAAPAVIPQVPPALGSSPSGAVPPPPSVAIPPAPPSRTSLDGRQRTPTLVIGIVLAVIAVGIVGGAVVLATRKEHHAVPIVDDRRDTGPVQDDNDDAGPELAVAPAPTLSSEPPKPKWRLPDGGAPEPCGAARRLRERGDASAAVIEKLDEKCRASGGTP